MNIAFLSARITFQKNETVIDATGNHLNTWTDYYTCFATLGSNGGGELYAAGRAVDASGVAFTVRYCAKTAAVDITGWRIVCDAVPYAITGVDRLKNNKKALKFLCEKERIADGQN